MTPEEALAELRERLGDVWDVLPPQSKGRELLSILAARLRDGDLGRALSPKQEEVLATGWGRLCHDAAGMGDYCDLDHRPTWEFFEWQAPRTRRVLLVEA